MTETQTTGVAFWRQAVRGCSQCAFQSNEITGALLVVAVAVFNWRMAVFFVLSVVVGTAVARLLKGAGELLDLGLYGFNSGIMGLALGNFFEPSTALSLSMLVCSVVTAAVTVAMSKWVPFPFLAAPFILTFWAVWPLAETLGLAKVEFAPLPATPFAWGTSVISALASTLFCSGLLSGILFLAGLALGNWRHAVVAVLGALIANALAAQAGVPEGPINSGFVGFNGVLAALAAYVVVAADLRLAALGALLATWLVSYVARGAPVPALASGFVMAIWAMLLLGWINPRFATSRPMPGADLD